MSDFRCPPKFMYKIHSLPVANGTSRSGGNDTFYDTYDAAIDRCRNILSGSPRASMVIYKATAIVESQTPPIKITQLD